MEPNIKVNAPKNLGACYIQKLEGKKIYSPGKIAKDCNRAEGNSRTQPGKVKLKCHQSAEN